MAYWNIEIGDLYIPNNGDKELFVVQLRNNMRHANNILVSNVFTGGDRYLSEDNIWDNFTYVGKYSDGKD